MFAADLVLQGDWLKLSQAELWQSLTANTLVDEQRYCATLLPLIRLSDAQQQQVSARASRWIDAIRQQSRHHASVETLLQHYSLDRPEGVALMTLAEALLRIPDSTSADDFIRDRLLSADWHHADTSHTEQPPLPTAPSLTAVSEWGLERARRWLGAAPASTDDRPATDDDSATPSAPYSEQRLSQQHTVQQLLHRLGEPLLREALKQSCILVANQFVMGEDIFEALDRSQALFSQNDSCSFDMLGEAALSRRDSDRYLAAYLRAITAVGQCDSFTNCRVKPSVSIKLSALHPRYDALHAEHCLPQLQRSLGALIEPARRYGVPLTIDAEESERLEPSLQLFERLLRGPAQGWGLLGLALQAYSKRALPQLCWLTRLSTRYHTPIPLRLVKGAYWDSEIKRAQQLGLSHYPLFTSKAATDISYLACARLLLSPLCQGRLVPQFASHNAQTLSHILGFYADDEPAYEADSSPQLPFECQRLHGMGEALYQAIKKQIPQLTCRVYAPVGAHQQLLPYLLRRLLENGANSSFINRALAPGQSVSQLAMAPDQLWKADSTTLATPPHLFDPQRRNSRGLNLQFQSQRTALLHSLQQPQPLLWAAPLIDGQCLVDDAGTADDTDGDNVDGNNSTIEIRACHDQQILLGSCTTSQPRHVIQAIETVSRAQPDWANVPLEQRCQMLLALADLLEQQATELITLLALEAGKCVQDSLAELREAVDFCRYYAAQAQHLLGHPQTLPGTTGEQNQLSYAPRGLFVCISPWNFPLAIFIGQVAAALVTGNGVIAKPASATPLIAMRCCQLLLDAGLPSGVLALLPGPSHRFMPGLLDNPGVAGVVFTGSDITAIAINRQLANRKDAAIAMLIAETAGINAMIVDTTVLPEQLVKDALNSAFGCAGQRCSALRILCLPEPLADSIEPLLQQAMDEWIIGAPLQLATDIGPVIDHQARHQLQRYIDKQREQGQLLHQCSLPDQLDNDHYVAPALLRLHQFDELNHEPFGPILHLLRYQPRQLDALIEQINGSGYGLTLAIQSRNISFAKRLAQQLRVGNIYINRDQVGSVVGCQPFGGCGRSGTGPKAGGPNYLRQFLFEKCISSDTTAWGGNSELLSQ